jgi:hypothetical protein
MIALRVQDPAARHEEAFILADKGIECGEVLIQDAFHQSAFGRPTFNPPLCDAFPDPRLSRPGVRLRQ